MINMVVQLIFFVGIVLLLARPLGKYIAKVAQGEVVFLSRVLKPIEKVCYRLIGTKEDKEMNVKEYIGAVLMFGVISLIAVFLLLKVQHILPLNPEGLPSVDSALAFNTAASFTTNTNWQAYSGETTLSYLSQMIGLTVQNFLSAAAGIAVLFALIRGFARIKSKEIGNFWVD
ncbi:MAG: potassium-transporting ATPase subunit KdpA, partial [Cellulosilyticaceae bacterium]